MGIEEKIWPIAEHTKAKHAILKRYLDAWLPIMGRKFSRVVYIDAFAGPGQYEKCEDGSPIVVIKAAENHSQNWPGELVCLFIEERKDRAENLEDILKKISFKRKIKWRVETKDCNISINSVLDELNKAGYKLAPTFAFLDPFGYTDVSYNLIKRLLDNERCEVFITFMMEGIVRNMPIKEKEDGITKFFGADEWKAASSIKDTKKKQKFLHDLYLKQMLGIDKVKRVFVRSFEMRNNIDKTSYYLFHVTKHPLGLEKMKEAMWSVDTRGTFQFSDVTDPKQSVLFTKDETNILENEIYEKFRNKTASIEEIEKFVEQDTAFLTTHVRKTLNRMESSSPSKIEVTTKRKRSTFPPGTLIKFK